MMSPDDRQQWLNASPGLAALWGGVLLGPIAWVLQLGVVYLLIDSACEPGVRAVMHVVSGGALLIALSGVSLASQTRRLARSIDWGEAGDGTVLRSRLISGCGLILSTFFSVSIVLLWIPLFVLDPCR